MKSAILAFLLCLPALSYGQSDDATAPQIMQDADGNEIPCLGQITIKLQSCLNSRLKEECLPDETTIKTCVKAYWHRKINSIRLTESVKNLAYKGLVVPLAGPAINDIQVHQNRLVNWLARYAVLYSFRAASDILIDDLADSSSSRPIYGFAEVIEQNFKPRKIVDHLDAQIDEIVEIAFSCQQTTMDFKPKPLSFLESYPIFAAARAVIKQTPVFCEGTRKVETETYWRSKLETARITESFKKRAFDTVIYSSLASPLVDMASLYLLGGYGPLVRIPMWLASSFVFSTAVDQGIKAWDAMAKNPENGISIFMEKNFHPKEIVDRLQMALPGIIDDVFAEG